jgi:hypothetical protein
LRAALLIALLVVFSAQPAAAAVHKVSFTETVSPGGRASLTVAVSPRARCAIHGVYDTTIPHALGLGRKTGSKITWTWMVRSATHVGRWPVRVDCGKSGRLTLRLHVLPAGEP